MGRACSTNGEKRNAYRILMGKPEGKRPLGRPRHRWVDNVKMDLAEIGWGGMDWIDLPQDIGYFSTFLKLQRFYDDERDDSTIKEGEQVGIWEEDIAAYLKVPTSRHSPAVKNCRNCVTATRRVDKADIAPLLSYFTSNSQAHT
jgi:hypothetical protein